MTRFLLAVLLAACGGGAAKPAAPKATAATELSPALSPLAWWLGDWKGEGGTEHWVAAAGAIYGVALHDNGSFEVMIVDDAEGDGPADGVLRLFAMPGGTKSVVFTHVSHAARSVVFGNPDHDDPKTIEYARTPQGLTAKLKTASGTHITFDFRVVPHLAAPELEAADRAFAADAKARGAEGWASWFAPDGWMWRKTGKIEGAAIAEAMKPLLSSGVLAWAPIASGKAGTLGYTVGKATFTGTAPDDHWTSSYVTLWKQQPGGTWKVLFDTGRGVNEP
jgi:ketosteroid isomerase-like protein